MADPIRSIKNQYPGINAHLHSLWQGVGGWNNFHNPHIAELTKALRGKLRLTGYTVDIEDSIQIRRADEYVRRPKSDITIYDTRWGRDTPLGDGISTSGVIVPLTMMLDDNPNSEKPYRAIVITDIQSETHKPVVWIEVLSPSNKRFGQDNESYIQKRGDLVEAGLVFIEIDYLHELPPTFGYLPDYSLVEKDAHPFRIVVLDPRPRIVEGHASVHEFDVDDSLPIVTIPLTGNDKLAFDFGIPYQKQYEEMFYGTDLPNGVDYRELPVNFDRYSEADQLRIARRMLTVIAAANRGEDLEQGPFPVTLDALPLEAALKQLEQP